MSDHIMLLSDHKLKMSDKILFTVPGKYFENYGGRGLQLGNFDPSSLSNKEVEH